MRRLLHHLIVATLFLVPSLSVSSAAAPKRAVVGKTFGKKPAVHRFTTKKWAHTKVNVKTYQKRTGKVVQAHQRTAPNKTQRDNWSAKGNVNPKTGKRGAKRPLK